jgi:hypothetical protein
VKVGDLITVRASGDVHGVFILDDCETGYSVHELSNRETLSNPTRTSIEIYSNLHVEDYFGRYINHDCNPTCEIQGYKVVAIKNMSVGDEVTFNYMKNETAIASPFVCRCCGILIGGKE